MRTLVVAAFLSGACHAEERGPCADLWVSFREASAAATRGPAASAAAATEADAKKPWFIGRCEAADPRVAGCLGEAIGDVAVETRAIAIAWNLPACVQKYRTIKAGGEGVGHRVMEALRAGRLAPGVVTLPTDLASASLDGTAWIGVPSDGQTWIFFPTWRGRGRNVAGYLWSTGEIATALISADHELAIPGFCLAEPCGANPEPEPFIVEDQGDRRWMFVRWAWD